MQALIAEAASLGLALTAPQIAAFERYQELLQYWNRRINLTTVDDAAGIRQRHFLDSLSCALVTGDLDGKRLVDVGTGAGFPGIPLKLLFPGVKLVLVESVSKKARFLQTIVQELALSGVEILDVRAETAGQDPSFREQFDWAVARAVAGLDVLLEYLLPFCRIGGHALAMKSERVTGEVERARQAIAILGGGDPLLHAVQLPQRDEISYLVVVEKIAPTPERYPRRPGMPAKRPL